MSFGPSSKSRKSRPAYKQRVAGGKREPPSRTAKSYATWLLSRREYSAKELSDKLVLRGYPVEEAAEALVLMQGYGFQDDTRFAGMKARASSRRMGDRRVTMQLAEKGISRELASQQLEQLEPEAERAVAVASKFEGKPLDEVMKAKVWRFLAYRGFGSSAVKAALQHLKNVQTASRDSGG